VSVCQDREVGKHGKGRLFHVQFTPVSHGPSKAEAVLRGGRTEDTPSALGRAVARACLWHGPLEHIEAVGIIITLACLPTALAQLQRALDLGGRRVRLRCTPAGR
jgi:hypothetical protein